MLIQQVRTSLEKYSEEELRLLAAEIYKRIPKKVIAEKEIDALLEDLQAVLQTRKQSRKAVALADHEAAVDYFKDHYVEAGLDTAYREEIKLYILLEKLLRYKQKDLWVREYETGLQRGIKPRRELVKAYEFTQKTGRLPEYIG